MGVMKKALEQKCGAATANLAMEKAKLASAQMAEARGEAQVKADQEAAKRQATEANKAMATARAAVAAKEKAKAALTDAQKQMEGATAKVKAVETQSKASRNEAKKLAENNGSDDEVKAAYAKASGLYATVMDAKMRLEMAKKRVTELGGKVDTADNKAKSDLLTAKTFTTGASDKVKQAMRAQVKAAEEKTKIAEKEASVVGEEQSKLLKESNELQGRIKTAQIKTKKAHDAVEMAKLAESRALEAVKLPAGASPEEAKAFQEAKFKVLAEQQNGKANYAAKIQNIESKLLDAREKARHAEGKLQKLTAQKNKLMSKKATEADSVLKSKMENEIKGINGAIEQQRKESMKAKKEMVKIEEAQKAQIKDVVEKVVLSQDQETKMLNANDAGNAQAYLAGAAAARP